MESKELIKALKALSDETRLRILNLLFERECCVCEVMQALDISQTRASRNLTVLYNAGFLKQRKEGLWTLYSLNLAGMRGCLPEILSAVKATMQASKSVARDKEKLRKAKRVGPGCARMVRYGVNKD